MFSTSVVSGFQVFSTRIKCVAKVSSRSSPAFSIWRCSRSLNSSSLFCFSQNGAVSFSSKSLQVFSNYPKKAYMVGNSPICLASCRPWDRGLSSPGLTVWGIHVHLSFPVGHHAVGISVWGFINHRMTRVMTTNLSSKTTRNCEPIRLGGVILFSIM